MNIYELQFSHSKYFTAAEDEQEAQKWGENPENCPDIHYLPFTLTKVEVHGYEITVTPIGGEEKTRRGRKAASV